jgi:beta-mannosidase
MLMIYVGSCSRLFSVHFYTYDLNGWDSNIYPQPRFASEYGFQSFPSYNSWLPVLNGSVDKLEALVDHRQHFPLGSAPIKVLAERNLPKLDANRDDYQKALIYFSQISQAMATKTETEVYM